MPAERTWLSSDLQTAFALHHQNDRHGESLQELKEEKQKQKVWLLCTETHLLF